MITTVARDDIHAFAVAVRSHLDDLPDDDVDELLDGLEADLSDQAGEAGDGFALPDAGAYAAELRAAAGLPARDESAPRHRVTMTQWAVSTLQRANTALRSNALGAWTLDTLVALRPVWWFVRAFVLYLALVVLFGIPHPTGYDLVDRTLAVTSLPGAVLFGTLLLLSIQWGRGRWAPAAWLRVVRTIVSALAAVAAPFLLIGAAGDARTLVMYPATADAVVPDAWGLSVDGQRVRNIYAYDAAGQPIEQVQLFDQDGRPLTTVGAYGDSDSPWDDYFYGGGGPVPVPIVEPGRASVWNVFPLAEIPAGTETWDAADRNRAVDPVFPFARVPALDATGDGETPTPTPTPTEASASADATAR